MLRASIFVTIEKDSFYALCVLGIRHQAYKVWVTSATQWRLPPPTGSVGQISPSFYGWNAMSSLTGGLLQGFCRICFATSGYFDFFVLNMTPALTSKIDVEI